jgi:hypothetical protein
MQIPDKAWIAVGTISVAMIAGLISFVNILIAKDQKTTEVRQARIDALRQIISEFISHALTLVSIRHLTLPIAEQAYKDGEKSLAFAKLRDFSKQSQGSLELKNRILLYLNPKKHVELIRDINTLYNASLLDSKIDGDTASVIAETVVRRTQLVLKSEWKRVKRGEGVYRTTKYVLGLFLLVSLFSVVYVTVRFGVPLFIGTLNP